MNAEVDPPRDRKKKSVGFACCKNAEGDGEGSVSKEVVEFNKLNPVATIHSEGALDDYDYSAYENEERLKVLRTRLRSRAVNVSGIVHKAVGSDNERTVKIGAKRQRVEQKQKATTGQTRDRKAEQRLDEATGVMMSSDFDDMIQVCCKKRNNRKRAPTLSKEKTIAAENASDQHGPSPSLAHSQIFSFFQLPVVLDTTKLSTAELKRELEIRGLNPFVVEDTQDKTVTAVGKESSSFVVGEVQPLGATRRVAGEKSKRQKLHRREILIKMLDAYLLKHENA